MLRKGPDFRIYVRWLDGEMRRTKKNVNPSFDEPESFVLEVQRGFIHANIGDISHYLNTGAVAGSPLTDISLTGSGNQISLHGTIHKLHIPLPIGLDGTLSPAPDGRIHLHVDRLSVLKLPVKGLLGDFHVSIADLMGKTSVAGIEASQNDLYFDTQKLLPAPHIHGTLTRVRVMNPDIEVMYGDAQNDVARTEQWHNFLALKGGTVDFGKGPLTSAGSSAAFVVKLDPSGTNVLYATYLGGSWNSFASALSVDAQGNVYVADFGNNAVQVVYRSHSLEQGS